MIRRIQQLAKRLICIALLGSLSGCVAAALVPVVPLVGGMLGSKNKVLIDETTVDPVFRAYLPTASRLVLLSKDPTAVYAAEHLETNSDYVVSLVAPPEAVSISQAIKHMETVCAGPENPDVVLYFRAPESNAGSGTTAKGVLTGRASFSISIETDALQCASGHRSQFTTVGKINQGVYNADQTRTNQILGHAFSNALLELAGKAEPAS